MSQGRLRWKCSPEKEQWLQNIKTVARKVDEEKRCIKFDEVGVKAFFESFEKVLKSSNFQGLILEILSTFLSQLKPILSELIELGRS